MKSPFAVVYFECVMVSVMISPVRTKRSRNGREIAFRSFPHHHCRGQLVLGDLKHIKRLLYRRQWPSCRNAKTFCGISGSSEGGGTERRKLLANGIQFSPACYDELQAARSQQVRSVRRRHWGLFSVEMSFPERGSATML